MNWQKCQSGKVFSKNKLALFLRHFRTQDRKIFRSYVVAIIFQNGTTSNS